MDLNEINVFIKVVQLGSFTQAARQLEMPNSTVSAKVSELEARLGVSLITRTTRKLSITPEGRAYYERCLRGLEEIRAAEEEVLGAKSEPQGLLKVTAPIDLGSTEMPSIIAEFRKRFPKVQIELFLGDRTVDLVSEGFDLAIRAGELKDSSLMAKKLGSVYFAPFASQAYLKKAGTPSHPKELRDHCCLQFTPLGTSEWALTGPKGTYKVPMQKQIVINELNALKLLAQSGLGIALLPTYLCYAETQSGKLIRILPEWRTNVSPVHFVYPAHKHVAGKVSAFMSVAGEIFKNRFQDYEL